MFPISMEITCNGTYQNCFVGQKVGAVLQIASVSLGKGTFYPPRELEVLSNHSYLWEVDSSR